MKRLAFPILICLCLLIFTSCNKDTSANSEIETNPNSTTSHTEISKTQYEIPINFESAILYCIDTGSIVYEYNSQEKFAPASIAKLMTAVVALENLPSSECFTVGNELNLLKEHSSLCLISKGFKLSVYDLITGMLMASGNDAAYTIAVNTVRYAVSENAITDNEAIDIFSNMMNECAIRIGMKNSHFSNPDGWDSENNYSTAYDLCLLSEYALSFPEIKEIVSSHKKYIVFDSGQNITWENTNKLLDPDSEFYISSAKGIKTGTTKSAKHCLSVTFETNSRRYIGIILGCKTDSDRYTAAKNLYSIIKKEESS